MLTTAEPHARNTVRTDPSSLDAAMQPASNKLAHRHWIPVRTLGAAHAERITAHLKALPETDRYLRFGYIATDEQIESYVANLDFDHGEVFGIFNRRIELVAFAHLAHDPAPSPGRASMSEFGVSVLPNARRKGFGARLFEHAMMHARNRGVETLFIHALSENAPMLRIARQAGATVERNGSESEAWLKLPPENMVSILSEFVEEQAAEINYQIKVNALRVDHAIEAVVDAALHFKRSDSDVQAKP